MAVLDSKYEILSQRTLSDEETVFDAVAPDGTALRIAWFELATPQEELQFERYRQLLRKLERKGLAAIHDIVSRPGTHYVAWYTPNTGWGKASPELEELLKTYNYATEHADIRSDKDKGVVYNLGFNSVVPRQNAPVIVPESSVSKSPFTFPDWIRTWGFERVCQRLTESTGTRIGRVAYDEPRACWSGEERRSRRLP